MSFATDVLFLYKIKPGIVAHRVMGSIRTFDKNGQLSHGYTQSLQHHYISRFTRKNLVDYCPMSRKISIFATKIN